MLNGFEVTLGTRDCKSIFDSSTFEILPPIKNLDTMLNFTYQQPSKENIVVNLSLYNPTDAGKKISARIDVPLEKPILKKMSDYKLTILRFQCPLTTVFPPYSLQGTEFQVTISTGYHSETRSSTGGTLSSYIGDFLEFLLNPLISACHSAMVTYINGADARRPPYVYYQPQEKLMHFVVPAEYDGSASIFVNRAVYKFISGFPFQKIDEDNSMLRYYAPDNSMLYSPPVQTTVNRFPKWQVAGEAIRVPQEYPSDYRFNQLQSVIVTSNLPIRQETLPQSTQQNVFNPSNPLSYISTLPILTDFRPDVNQFGLQNSSLIYFPTGEFRWIDLLSDGPLDRLSFDFLWQSTDQQIHELELNPGESVSLKLHFRSLY
jgi:hypothetical protein